MKNIYKLTLYIALITLHCWGMDVPQKSVNIPRQPQSKILKEAKPLKDISLQNVMKHIITIINKSITDPVIMQQKINTLLQNADGSALNLISEELYNKLKLPIINQLTQFPLITIPETEGYFVSTIQFDPSGNHCMVLKTHIKDNREPKLLEIYTIPNFELVKQLSLDCNYARYSPQGKFISASKKSKFESKIILLDVHNDFEPYLFDMQSPAQTIYCFNTQEDHLITCDAKGLIKLWDINTQKPITADTQLYGNYFNYIEPVQNYIIALDTDKRTGKIQNIILISEENNTLKQHVLDVSMQEISSGYCKTALYPAKNVLALSSGDNLFVYDLKTDQLLKQFSCDDSINHIAFHPSGKFVAAASDDWTTRIWNIGEDSIEGNEHILSVENSRHVVQGVSFSPITDIVLSCDEFIRLWDISTPKPTLIGSFKEGNDESPIIICPNTKHGLLFTKNSSENIWFFPTPNFFNVQQLIWIYSAYWAKKNLKEEKRASYIANLASLIDTVFDQQSELIKKNLRKIAKP